MDPPRKRSKESKEAPRGREGMEAPEGPPRFECPPDFCAGRFAPGPPFSLERLQDPSKQLLLIRAPAHFSPESLDGHVLPLSGSQTLKVPQPNGAQKVYSIHATPGVSSSCARLLVPSGHQDHLTCAPPFSGSLSIWERFGDPSANPTLFPVADRLAPQIPEGLKQRFVPFGGQWKRPAPREAVEKPPRKKKKKRQLQTVWYMGDPEENVAVADGGPETPLEESMPAAEGKRNRLQLKKEVVGAVVEGEEEEQDSQPSSSLLAASQESPLSAEAPSHKSKKKKKKLKIKEEVVDSEELPAGSGFLTQQSQSEPGLQLEFEPPVGETSSTGMEELVRHKPKKRKKKHEEEATTGEALVDSAPLKKEAVREPWEASVLGSPTEGLELDLSGHKSKKKKKKKEKMEMEMEEQTPPEQAGGTVFLESSSVKEELTGWDELETSYGEGVVQGESLEPSMEAPSHKHKKKKKKELKREAD